MQEIILDECCTNLLKGPEALLGGARDSTTQLTDTFNEVTCMLILECLHVRCHALLV